MNERYPVISSSYQSGVGNAASTRKSSRAGSREPQTPMPSRPGSRKASTETVPQTSVKIRDRAFSTESIAEHDVVDLIQNALITQHVKEAALTANSNEDLDTGRQSAAASTKAPAVHSTKNVNRPKSAYELRVNYRNAASSKAKPLEVRRKPVDSNMLEDNTIRNISAGPYAIRRLDSPNRENARPLESPLPAVSSSEWLAAGTKKRKEVRKASSMHPLARPVSRSSPSNSPKRSLGQRMVTNWLDERKMRESTPAFV